MRDSGFPSVNYTNCLLQNHKCDSNFDFFSFCRFLFPIEIGSGSLQLNGEKSRAWNEKYANSLEMLIVIIKDYVKENSKIAST